jgi:acetyl esterase/lipase
LRGNASKFGIQPNRIIAAGGSAGGHLVAASAVIEGFNDSQDDLSVSTVANALVLFNPVIDNSPTGYGNKKVANYWREFSPLHNIASYKKHPPTLVMLGDKDELIPVQTAQQYVDAIVKTGAASKLVVYENELHGFFNKNRFVETLLDTHIFLYQLGFTSYPPTKHDEAK